MSSYSGQTGRILTFLRAETSQSSLRRSIIRHMYILFDLSSSMAEKDLRPNR